MDAPVSGGVLRRGAGHRRRVRAHSDLHLFLRSAYDDARLQECRRGRWPTSGTATSSSRKLVNPANRRRHTVIVVGTGLAGASAASSLGELGYNVLSFCIHDSPRRAHSIAAQGGINAAKNYQNDGDSIQRLFYDTIKGGDYRAREANVYRLAQLSAQHHRPVRGAGRAVRARVRRPARQPVVRRRAGVAHVLRARPDGAAAAARRLSVDDAAGRARHASSCSRSARCSTSSWSTGAARGIICRNLVTGELERYVADAVCLATGGYGTAYYLSTNAVNSNVTAAWRAHKRGALFANPCFTQIHPTCIPVSGEHQSKLTLMSESLRNDGRVWVPKSPGDNAASQATSRRPSATTTSSASIRASATSCRATSRRATRRPCATTGRGVGDSGLAVYLDFRDAIERLGQDVIAARYGNLFEMYQKITDENPYQRADADLSRPSTTRWAGSGWTTT